MLCVVEMHIPINVNVYFPTNHFIQDFWMDSPEKFLFVELIASVIDKVHTLQILNSTQ